MQLVHDLIELRTVVEVLGLDGLEPSEYFLDREQLQLGEGLRVACAILRVPFWSTTLSTTLTGFSTSILSDG